MRLNSRVLAPALTIITAAASLALSATSFADPRIVGGRSATPADPAANSTVALIDPSAPSAYAGFYCGGTLVAPQLVVTARHCVDEPPFLTPPRQIDVVRSSDLRLAKKNFSGMARSRVLSIHRSPGLFGAASKRGADIALLRLEQPLAGAETLAIAHPGDEAWWGGDTGRPTGVFALGWGASTDANARTGAEPGGYPADLKLAELPTIATETCAANALLPTVTRNYLCAGVIKRSGESPRTACYGDSGGPLVATDPTGVDPAARRLVGVVSYGEEYECAGDYGRYVRVANFATWIDGFGAGASGAPSGVIAPKLSSSKIVAGKTKLSISSIGSNAASTAIVVRTAYDAGLEVTRKTLIADGQTAFTVGLPPTPSGKIALTLHGIDTAGDESAPGDRVLVPTKRDRAKPVIKAAAAKFLGSGRWRIVLAGMRDDDRVSAVYVEERKKGAKRWVALGVHDCVSCWTGGAGVKSVFTAYDMPKGTWQFRVTPLDRAGNVGKAVVTP